MIEPLNQGDAAQGRFLAWWSYLPFGWLLPMVSMKNNSFCHAHEKQGIILQAFLWIVAGVGGIPLLGWLAVVLGLPYFLLSTWAGIVRASRAKKFTLWFFGGLANRFHVPGEFCIALPLLTWLQAAQAAVLPTNAWGIVVLFTAGFNVTCLLFVVVITFAQQLGFIELPHAKARYDIKKLLAAFKANDDEE